MSEEMNRIEKVMSAVRDAAVVGAAILLYVQAIRIENVDVGVQNATAELSRISAKQDKIVDRLKDVVASVDAMRAAGESKLVKFDELLHECEANNSEATCDITNPNEYAVTTCFVGTVVRKGSSMKIHTIVGCTGRMEPRSTVKVSAPFHNARVSYLCPREGLSSLPDWDKCDFAVAVPSVDNVKP